MKICTIFCANPWSRCWHLSLDKWKCRPAGDTRRKVSRTHPLGTVNVWTKSYSNPSYSYRDILVGTKVVDRPANIVLTRTTALAWLHVRRYKKIIKGYVGSQLKKTTKTNLLQKLFFSCVLLLLYYIFIDFSSRAYQCINTCTILIISPGLGFSHIAHKWWKIASWETKTAETHTMLTQ